jgi:hypothetical protein
MTEGKKKRGRPPLSLELKIKRVVDQFVTDLHTGLAEIWRVGRSGDRIDRAALTATMQSRVEAQRNRKGGRPTDHAINLSLREGWIEARRHGMKKQAFVKKWFKGKYGRAAEPEEVSQYERRLNRQLAVPKSRPNIKSRIMSDNSNLKLGFD